jgi:uncharacterized protein
VAANVEVIRAAIEAFNVGDLDAMLAIADPDLEWRPAFGAATLGATAYRGHGGFRDYWRSAQEVWDAFRFEPEQFIERGDQVVVIGRGSGRARGSGIEIDQPFAMLWRLRAGKTVFGQTFADPALALRAAGVADADAR